MYYSYNNQLIDSKDFYFKIITYNLCVAQEYNTSELTIKKCTNKVSINNTQININDIVGILTEDVPLKNNNEIWFYDQKEKPYGIFSNFFLCKIKYNNIEYLHSE